MKWRMIFSRFIEDTRTSGHEEKIVIDVDIPSDFRPQGIYEVK